MEEEPKAEMPDIADTDSLRVWMKQNIKKPPLGYDAIKHPDGTPLTPDEQIDAYIKQTIDVIELNKKRGTLDKVRNKINIMLQPPLENTTLKHM